MNKHMNTDPSLHMEDDSLPSLRPHGEAEFQSREAGKGNVLTNQRRGKCGLCVFCLLFVSLLFSALLFSSLMAAVRGLTLAVRSSPWAKKKNKNKKRNGKRRNKMRREINLCDEDL